MGQALRNSFRFSEFAFAKVDGNYTDLYLLKEGKLEKRLVRIPLKILEGYFEHHPEVFKTHRSYLLNTSYIQSVSGNAQGYEFSIRNSQVRVPVSRSKISQFNALLSQELK